MPAKTNLAVAEAKLQDQVTRERIRSFLHGEITWAQVEGMTEQKAKQVAQLGCQLAERGRLEEARILFEGLVAGNPRDAAAHAALGGVYQRLNRREAARAALDRALRLEPTNPVALANRGELRLRGGDRGGADDLMQAVKADARGATSSGRRARSMLEFLARLGDQQTKGGR